MKQKALLIFATLLVAVGALGQTYMALGRSIATVFSKADDRPEFVLEVKADSCFAGTSVAIETMISRNDKQRNNSNFLYLCTSK